MVAVEAVAVNVIEPETAVVFVVVAVVIVVIVVAAMSVANLAVGVDDVAVVDDYADDEDPVAVADVVALAPVSLD